MRIAPSSAAGNPSTPAAKGSAAPGRPFVAVLDERLSPAAQTPPMISASAAARATPAVATMPAPRSLAGPVRAMLERAMGSEKQIDALLDAAARGKTFKPGELLAMQATVARYSQTVEVVSRVADRLVGAVKQTMGTQV
jgi:hypothetical protein